MYFMTFVEETESEHKTKLSLWGTTEKKLWIEVGADDPEDPWSMQGIVLDLDDARKLLQELTGIVKHMENEERSGGGPQEVLKIADTQESSLRKEDLSFNHHKEVASLGEIFRKENRFAK